MRGKSACAPTILDFTRILVCIERELPIAPSQHNPLRFFLANGGCISLETGSNADLNHSLIETATPECKSPTELLAYQIANERLVTKAVQKTYTGRDACLLKSTSDAHGHVFGQHESYDMEIARGWRLLGWRLGLVAIFPILVVYRLLAVLWFLAIWILATSERLVVRAVQSLFGGWNTKAQAEDRAWEEQLNRLHPKSSDSNSLPEKKEELDRIGSNVECDPMPSPAVANSWRSAMSIQSTSVRWLLLCAWGLRQLHLPVLWAFSFNLWLFALRPHRRYLGAFFASRCILDGAGHVDEENRFWVSHRASLVDRMIGFGSYSSARPIFRCDAMLKDLFAGSPWQLARFARLFRVRQRIEIATGDSGLCHQSQFLRFGVTSLVIDLVERGAARDMPRLRSPLNAISRFAKDWMLLNTVPDRKNKAWTAIEIQQEYAMGVRSLLQRSNEVPIEAWRILDCWQTTLNQLVLGDEGETLPRHMLGRIDWINKLWLLQQMDSETPWAVRKKIDIRYHELSSSGYQQRFADLLQVAPVARDVDIERAARVPPSQTPASKRGYLIREFASSDSEITVDWESASYELENKRRFVRFKRK